jgi:hypothetical protein
MVKLATNHVSYGKASDLLTFRANLQVYMNNPRDDFTDITIYAVS